MAKISSKFKQRAKRVKIPAVVAGIQSVADLQENHVAMFYGKAGTGKTKTASTFPGPILFLDINNEKGLKTVRKMKDVKVAQVRTWDDFIELYWWLRDGQDFKTIVLDQITGLQDLCMKAVREHFRMDEDEPFQGFKKWGKLSGDMKTWLGNYRELIDLYNVVFLAHLREFGGEGDNEDNEIDPSVSARVLPSVGSYVDGACDIIGHTFIRIIREKKKTMGKKPERRIEYAMRIGPHPNYVTKIRRPPDAGRLPEFIVDPSYRKLVAIESGEIIKSNVAKKEKVNGKKLRKAR
jgi:hypothetical protein